MNNASNAWQMERVKKEFLKEMRQKGKLPPGPKTEAYERFAHSYFQTGPRLFPGPGGIETTLATMLREAENHIDAAQVPLKSSCSGRPQDKDTTRPCRRQERKEIHRELQARLNRINQQLEAERHCRKISEERLIQAKLEKEKMERRAAEQQVAKIREQQSQVEPDDIVPYKSSSLVNYSSAVGSKWLR